MRLLAIALLTVVAAATAVVADLPSAGPGGKAQAAEYCVDAPSITAEGRVVYPGGTYCVPGPPLR